MSAPLSMSCAENDPHHDNLLRKCDHSGTDFYLGLMAQRNTPTDGMTESPAQKFFNRRMRTTIPVYEKRLQPEIKTNEIK